MVLGKLGWHLWGHGDIGFDNKFSALDGQASDGCDESHCSRFLGLVLCGRGAGYYFSQFMDGGVFLYVAYLFVRGLASCDFKHVRAFHKTECEAARSVCSCRYFSTAYLFDLLLAVSAIEFGF